MSLNHKMAEKHEADLAESLGGRRTRGSGNQFNNPMDGRHDRYAMPVAFAWDGKSTRSASIGVSRAMGEKAVEQAHGERPMLALRFYTTDRLDYDIDLVAVDRLDMSEMLTLIADQARIIEELRAGAGDGVDCVS